MAGTDVQTIEFADSFRAYITNWRATSFGLVDSRLPADFTKVHVSGSTNVPHDDLSCRAQELPPRSSTVCLLSGSKEECTAVLSYLESHDYKVAMAAHVDPKLLEAELDFLVRGSPTSAIIWEPSPVLKGVIDTVERLRKEDGQPSCGVAIDLACGSGRDCVFLAHRGWKSTGYDYLEDSLERARRLASRYGTTIETVCADLEKEEEAPTEVANPESSSAPTSNATEPKTTAKPNKSEAPAAVLEGIHADLVNVSRYLHRPIMPAIADMINPGGFIVYHQFMVGCTKPRRARFLLEEGELAQLFTEHDFEVVEDRVFPISDGRPCSWFLARKKLVSEPQTKTEG